MPSFNFKTGFADAVQSGAKQQTIRAERIHPPRVGQTAHCFTGMRTKKCRRLGQWRIDGVTPIVIVQDNVYCYLGKAIHDNIFDYKRQGSLHKFAVADGFKDWPTMRDWFKKTHGLPFYGDVVHWDYRKQEKT